MAVNAADRLVMGTLDQAQQELITKAREWRALRQPQIATRQELKTNDRRE